MNEILGAIRDFLIGEGFSCEPPRRVGYGVFDNENITHVLVLPDVPLVQDTPQCYSELEYQVFVADATLNVSCVHNMLRVTLDLDLHDPDSLDDLVEALRIGRAGWNDWVVRRRGTLRLNGVAAASSAETRLEVP